MIDPKLLSGDAEYIAAIAEATYDLRMPEGLRTRAAGGCFAIAQDHHHGINILLGAGRLASALALVRSIYEAYVRGAWLDACASEQHVEQFLAGGEPPALRNMLSELEQTERFQGGVLSAFKSLYWDQLCDFTHAGGLHVQRWNSDAGIEPNYDPEDIRQAIVFAQYLSGLSAIATVRLAGREDLVDELSARLQALLATSRHSA
jgi:hypothetical protein